MNLEQVKQDIEKWIVDFVEVPNLALGGWPPCPYARRARLAQSFEVRLGANPYYDLIELAETGLGGKEVIVLAYDPSRWAYLTFHASLDLANTKHLISKDIIALEDHPDDPEIVNGICMNQGKYALSLVQGLSDLNAKAALMARQGFYDAWPEEYLQVLFHHRKDPRANK